MPRIGGDRCRALRISAIAPTKGPLPYRCGPFGRFGRFGCRRPPAPPVGPSLA